MSDKEEKALPKIRTFAGDMEEQHKKTGQALPENIAVPIPIKANTTATPSQHKTSTPLANIPAFHELHKKADSITAHPNTTPVPLPPAAKKVSVRAKKRQNFAAPIKATGGTVITDAKHAEFNFFSSLIAAISGWFSSLAQTKKRKVHQYTVTETEHRKGVIQKATSKSGAIFTADSDTLRDEIRRRKHTNTPAQHDSTISWSPNNEPGYALLDTPEHEPTPPAKPVVNVTFKQQSTPQPVVPQAPTYVPPPVFVEPTTPQTMVPEPAPVQTPSPAPTYTPPPVSSAPEAAIPQEFLEPVLQDLPQSEQFDLIPYEGVSPFKVRSFGDLIRLNTNILTLSITGFIGLIVVLVIIVKITIGIFSPEEGPVIAAPEAIIKTMEVRDTALSDGTKEALINTLDTTEVELTSTEIRLVDASGIPYDTQSVLLLVGFSTNQNLNQSITEAHLATAANERALILKITDATSVFGGLLSFEPNMANDLGAILHTEKQPDGAKFVDRTIGNHDVRVLEVGGEVVLMYGFVDQNAVIITTSESAFMTMLGS